ncbi:hypothetical protein M406DRAFT_38994 [Cryphonectria parasitica EP155]|uniref:Autophagy-related protein 33 n=1 Tax=Cryphonectria parasitica (strain ATCC 38755 / EP155) TaxID=660469 RepID=A0A9P4Y5K0_CRYP1|nr:uncharacterized protein M406DRAFT_38994 [Cryphonectria parasitica EP155]KAF3767332.1 hypothetical protein M406DRAFT_38994 [Cryphonectria parasitica EP155]
MASRGVSVLKFVGTVSLGLLTGLSYSLSTLTVPTLLDLPSASSASRAFKTLATAAKAQLRTLAAVSGTSFFLAFALSPRAFRHPYLLYTSVLVLASRFALPGAVAPYLINFPQHKSSSASAPPRQQSRKDRSAARHMEMSYDMIGSDVHSEATLDSASEKSIEDDNVATPTSDNVNGEEVRSEVEDFLKKQIVSTAVAGLGFVMAVIGIWGDGVAGYVSEAYVNVIEI